VHKRDDQLAHRNQRFHGQLGAVECPVNTAGRGSQAASGAPEVTHSCNRARFEPSNILAGSPMDGLGVSRTGARPDGDGNPRNLRIGPEIYDTSSATGTNKESDLASVDLHGRRACDLSASACTVLLGLGERLGDLDGLHRGHDRAGLGTGVEQQLAMSCREIRYNSSTATADDHASRPPSRDAAGHHRGWPVRHPQAPTGTHRHPQTHAPPPCHEATEHPSGQPDAVAWCSGSTSRSAAWAGCRSPVTAQPGTRVPSVTPTTLRWTSFGPGL
jgi:hypothetical protein